MLDSMTSLGLLLVSCICMRIRFWSGGGLKPELGSHRHGCVSEIRCFGALVQEIGFTFTSLKSTLGYFEPPKSQLP